MHTFLSRTSHAAAQRLRLIARAEDGFTIIEVVMSSVIVILIAGGVLTGIDAAGRTSADVRHRSQAQELAHQDQERMRGMSAQQVSGLDETRPVTVDGTTFQVHSTGQFLSHTGGGSSCGGESADYIKVVSTVDWQPLNKRPPVVVQSIVTPPIGGTMIVRVLDQSDVGVPSAAVSVTGPENASAATDSGGCAIFAGMEVGDYTVTASRSGYVNPDGGTLVTAPAHVTTAETAIPLLDPLGLAGAINASFSTRVDGSGSPCATGPNYCTGQFAPSLSWYNLDAYDGIAQTRNATPANGSTTIRTHATDLTLFPFAVGTDTTNNWTVWGGSCAAAKPPAVNLSFATMNPGATATPVVRLPALIVKVTYGGASAYVRPDQIRLTGPCGQIWSPALRGAAGSIPDNTSGTVYNRLGALDFPGQPYAAAGGYNVCADYDPPGATTRRQLSVPSANSNFTTGTAVQVNLISTDGNGSACP